MDGIYRRNPDGSYEPAEPVPYYGWKARCEQWCLRHKMRRMANMLARWDERGLG
jgi:hypothetical protein